MKLSVIIPVYNEAKTVEEVIKLVEAVNIDKEIITVDDGSYDGSLDVLTRIANEGRVKLIKHDKNSGKGAAIKTGLKAAAGDFIIVQDADLEYSPNDYLKLLKPVIAGKADIVFGSRNLGNNNVPINRYYFYGGLLSSKVFNFLFGTHFTDIHTCYKLFPRNLVPVIVNLPANDFVFDAVELTNALRENGRIVEVSISYVARSAKEGKKLNWRHGVKCLIAMIGLKRFFN